MGGAPLQLRTVVAEMGAAYRDAWPLLLGAGLAVFIPVGLVEAIDNPLDDVDVVDFDAVTAAEVAALLAAQSVGPLLASVVYAAIVSAVIEARREGRRPSLAVLLRRLPYGRLVLADLALALIVAAGVLVLVIPGLVLLTWFALAGPAIELERRGVLSAFRRSRELVRPQFWRVFALVVPALAAEGVIAGLAESEAVGALGESLAGEWVGSVIANLVAAPVFALAVAVLFLELRARSTRPAPR